MVKRKNQRQPGAAGAGTTKQLNAGNRTAGPQEFRRYCSDVARQGGPVCISFGDDTPWSRDDAAWFREHPHRSFRLRPVIPGEVPTAAAKSGASQTHVLVRQMAPGYRDRSFFSAKVAADADAACEDASDHELLLMWLESRPGKDPSVKAQVMRIVAMQGGVQ